MGSLDSQEAHGKLGLLIEISRGQTGERLAADGVAGRTGGTEQYKITAFVRRNTGYPSPSRPMRRPSDACKSSSAPVGKAHGSPGAELS
jgi:hypothetical protein